MTTATRTCNAVTGTGDTCGKPAKAWLVVGCYPLCGVHARAHTARGDDVDALPPAPAPRPLTADDLTVGEHYLLHRTGSRPVEVVVLEKRDVGAVTGEPVIHYGRPSRKHPGDYTSHSATFASVEPFTPLP